MGEIRNKIIDVSRNESQKNVTIFYTDIKKIEIKNTCIVAWVSSRYRGSEHNVDDYQKVQLINADRFKLEENAIENFGIMVLQTTPGRYAESFGILIRKNVLLESKNEASDRMPS